MFCCIKGSAQNLVPNPGFDILTACPGQSNSCSINLASPWRQPLMGFGNSQVNNACAQTNYCSAPDASNGNNPYYQVPRSGDGFAGIFFYNGGDHNNRQYLSVPLTQPLLPQKLYFVEYFANLVNYAPYGTNNIGANFSNFLPTATGIEGLIPLNPSIISFSNPIVLDTLNWTRLGGIYQAEGSEDWLTIGNFKNDSNTAAASLPGGMGVPGYPCAYLFDDISVIPLDSFLLPADAGPDRTITEGDSTFIGTYINGLTCTWYNAAGQVINTVAPGFKVAPTTSTWYALKQEVAGQTAYDTVNVFVIPLTVKEEELLAEIHVYPNPTDGLVHVSVPMQISNQWQIKVTAVDGRTLPIYNFTSTNGTLQFSLNVSPGMYYVHVENLESHAVVVKKLMVK